MIKLELTPKEHKELKNILYGFERERDIRELRDEFYSLKNKISEAPIHGALFKIDRIEK